MYTRDSTATSHQVVIHVVEVVLEGVGAGGGGQDAGLGVAEAPVQQLHKRDNQDFVRIGVLCWACLWSIRFCDQLWPLVYESQRALLE